VFVCCCCCRQVFDLLLGMSDFAAFKELMLETRR
jgi:hypothetical protein